MPQEVTLEIVPSLGMNTAFNPSELPNGAQRLAKNSIMREVNTISKRDGSAPVTSSALSTIKHLTEYRFNNSVTVGAAPTLSAVAGSATLPTATYYVRYTYVTDVGETASSAEANQAIVLGEKLHIVVPAIPYHANSINVYISASTNTETRQYNTTTLATDQIIPLIAGTAYPTVSTTAFSGELLASAGTSLYSYYNGALNSATMTNALASSNIYTVGFTNTALTSILFIADGGALKKYNGSAVALIAPAADDAGPAPANGMAAINLLLPIYCWVHTGHLMVSDGRDVVYYSKQYEYDYFPVTYYERWVNNNDYITGPGFSFGNICVIPMRRHWAILTGSAFGTFSGNVFLNTTNGNIAPRGIAKVTYPQDGAQTIAYLSDDGVYEIFDTGFIDSSESGSRNYGTRPLMKEKIDFTGIGFTEAEKTAAYMEFDAVTNLLKLKISRSTTYYMYVMDVRNKEWYMWILPSDAKPSLRYGDISYFAGTTGLLHKFDESLYTDYSDFAQTTGTIVDFDVYSGLLKFEFTGDGSYLHYYLCEAQQWPVPSVLDVTIVYSNSYQEILSALQNEIATWDSSRWDFAQFANDAYTDIVNDAKRLVLHHRAKYFQRRWRNPRNEPVTILRERFVGTISGRS